MSSSKRYMYVLYAQFVPESYGKSQEQGCFVTIDGVHPEDLLEDVAKKCVETIRIKKYNDDPNVKFVLLDFQYFGGDLEFYDVWIPDYQQGVIK